MLPAIYPSELKDYAKTNTWHTDICNSFIPSWQVLGPTKETSSNKGWTGPLQWTIIPVTAKTERGTGRQAGRQMSKWLKLWKTWKSPICLHEQKKPMWRDYMETFPNMWHTRRTQTLKREHKDQSLPGLTWEGRQTINTGFTGQWTTSYNLRDMLPSVQTQRM